MSGAFGGAAYGGAAFVPLAGNSPGNNLNSGKYPTLAVQLGFGSGPNVANPTWTNVANDVLEISIDRGRQHELNRFEAGTLSIRLNNRNGTYSPWNTTSPYTGQMVPMVQVRVQATYNGVVYTVFRGLVEAWQPHWPTVVDSEMVLSCVDQFNLLNLKRATNVNTSYASTILASSPFLFWRLGDAPGVTVAADSSGNGRTGVVSTQTPTTGARLFAFGVPGAVVGDNDTALDCGSTAGSIALSGLSFDGRNSTVEFWINYQSPGGGDDVFQINNGASKSLTMLGQRNGNLFTFASDGTNSISFTSSANLADGRWHHVAFVVSGTGATGTLYVDGFRDSSGNASPGSADLSGLTQFRLGGSVAGIAWDGQLDEFAMYQSALSSTTVQGNYNAGINPLRNQLSGARVTTFLTAVGVPVTQQVVDAGNSTLQSVSAATLQQSSLTHLQSVADTEGGYLFVDAAGAVRFYDRVHTSKPPFSSVAMILGDVGAAPEEPYLVDSVGLTRDTLDLYNQTIVTPNGQGAQEADDLSAQATYGVRSLSRSSLASSNVESLGQAQNLLARYKAPKDRVSSVSFTPMSDPDVLFPAALGFELLTLVELRRRTKDGSGVTFDQQARIEGISHHVVQGQWVTTWRLSPSDTSLTWVIDDPVAGAVIDSTTVSIGY